VTSTDIVIIGAGHQGLVAGVVLAEAGLDVTVVEAADEVGGAVRSSDLVQPGLEQDLYATNMNLFLGSPFYQRYSAELSAAGLAFAHADHAYASAFPDGRSLRVTSDEAETTAMWEAHDPRDAAGWLRLREVFDDVSASYLPLASHSFPSWSSLGVGWRMLARREHTTLTEMAQLVASSTRALGERYFATPEARSVVAAWGMHLDFAPDVAVGAVFPLLELYLDAQVGMNLVRGGASRLPEALCRLLESRGGAVLTGRRVEAIELSGGRAHAVRLQGGERLVAAHGVVSTATLPALVHDLLRDQPVPSSMRSAADRYRFGPGTFMLHLALSGPVPWLDPRLATSAYVHAAPYVDDMARTYQQALAGTLPDDPLLVIGQTSVVDPSRSSGAADGSQAVWVQVRAVPARITGDALPTGDGGDLSGQSWSTASKPFADRVLAKMERYAPGISERVVGLAAASPSDLESANANLRGGDSVSGSHQLDQFIGMRPALSLSRYGTPIAGLYLAGAGTWPGAGVNAVSGQRAAERVLRDLRGRRLTRLPFRSVIRG
jgi:phytoene dehydrogenase-like protein